MTEHHNLIAQREDSNSIIYKSQAVFLYIVPVIYIIGHIRHVRYVGDFSVVLNVVWYQLCFISLCCMNLHRYDTNRQYKETIDWCISKSYTMLITVCRLSWSNSVAHSITSMITLRHSCIYIKKTLSYCSIWHTAQTLGIPWNSNHCWCKQLDCFQYSSQCRNRSFESKNLSSHWWTFLFL